ncbi:MAG: hypothetical protein U0176_11155 [Bacteroidia bacterium]
MAHNTEGMRALMEISAGNAAEFRRLSLAAKRFTFTEMPSVANSALPETVEVDWQQVLGNASWEHFNFKAIEAQHTFWKEGITVPQLSSILLEVLPSPIEISGNEPLELALKTGSGARVMLKARFDGKGKWLVHRFHPSPGPGSVSLNGEELVAIAKLLGVPFKRFEG